MKKKKKSSITLFISIFLFRCCCTFIQQSYFVADEYWQSVEVAHKFVFDYGFLTWEWKKGIRSFLFPSIFIYLFEFLKIFHLDSPLVIRWSPRIIMCIFQALQDIFVYEKSGKKGLLIFLSLWPTSYIGTRTLSNSFESLLIILLYHFEAPIFLIVISFWIRPNSIIASSFLFFFIFKKNITFSRIIEGIFSVLFCCVYDAFFYSQLNLQIPLCTPFNFFKSNLIDNIAIFYGSQPFLFYFYSCIPSLFGPLIFVFHKCYKNKFFIFAMIYTLLNSFIAHKEIRYIYPIIPFVTIAIVPFVGKKLFLLNTLLHICATVFLGQFHQICQGTITSMISRDPTDTLFLLPCHSTPFYSHVHQNISLSFLECPNHGMNPSKEFLLNPSSFVQTLTPMRQIVVYESFTNNISKWLNDNNYTKIYSHFNTFFFIDGINASDISVFRQNVF